MGRDNQSDSGDRKGDRNSDLSRVIDGASGSSMDEVLDAWGRPPTRTKQEEKQTSSKYELEHNGEQGEKLLFKLGIEEKHEKTNESLDTEQLGMMALSGHPVAQAADQMLKTPQAQDKTIRDGIKRDASNVLMDWFKEQFQNVTNVVTGFDKWVTSALNVQNVRNFGESIRRAAFGHSDQKHEPAPITGDMETFHLKGVENPQDVVEYGVSTTVGATKALSQAAPMLTPQGFAKANHDLAEGGREAIRTAGEYYGEHGISSLPADTVDATKTAYDRLGQWSADRMQMEPGERGDVTGSAMAAAGFFLMGKRILNSKETANVLGVEESTLATASEEQLAARGLTKIPKDKLPIAKDGKPLQFTEESGIEIFEPTGKNPDSIWSKGWSTRGFEGEGEMGSSGILAKNFPTIDDAYFIDGKFPSMKTIDLSAPTYQNLERLEKRLNSYLDKISEWNGQERPWGGHTVNPDKIQEKILHLGIPNGTMTAEQKTIFEQIGKRARQLDIRMKVTVIE